MAHILIGRYRALTEAEAIVHDLVEQGFARSQMTGHQLPRRYLEERRLFAPAALLDIRTARMEAAP
jgi:hypothetical protein